MYVAFILGGALLGERVRLVHYRILQTYHCLSYLKPDMTACLTLMSSIANGGSLMQVLNAGFDRMWENNNKGVRLGAF